MCRPAMIQMSRHRADSNVQSRPAHAPPLVVAYPKWSVHHVAAAPGRPRGRAPAPPPAARGLPPQQAAVIAPGPGGASSSSGGPITA